MAPERNSLQVGKTVLLEGMGEFLCERDGNGTITFLGKEGETVVRYIVQRPGIWVGAEGYRVDENFATREVLKESSHGYTQAVDLVRRARI